VGITGKRTTKGMQKLTNSVSVFTHDTHWVPEEKCNAGHFEKQKYL
jgi:hypothetical protein